MAAVTGVAGMVKSWNGAKGFGFLSCTTLPGDIFFGRSELPEDLKEVQGKFMDGRHVVFDAEPNADGRYKATAVAVPYVEGKEIAGKIKTYNPMKRYGFITSSSLTEDVRFQTTDLPQGTDPNAMLREELVSFEVQAMPDGKLRVSSLKFQNKKIAMRHGGMGMMGMPGMPGMMGRMDMGGMGGMGGKGGMGKGGGNMAVDMQAAQAAQAQGLQTGTVKSYGEKNGYGFLNVVGYPMDIKFGCNELAGGMVSPGETVSFSPVQTPDGRIAASNVSSLSSRGNKRPASAMGGMMGMPGMMGMGMPGMMGMGMMGMGGMMKKGPATTETSTGRSAAGMIKTYNSQKGFGFISSPGIPGDVFFMKTSLPAEVQMHGKDLQGKSVNFEVSQTSDGKMRAQNICTPY
ncbi:unnamed protein product [Polarella glacialis]|uniref:CSD domain-containing protein n=1 Tax=Polarella glacialis TaxID=89957 RepID=A0A813HI50_POLGL|nr:unnamed protein product [Polarella glacialis]